VTDIFFSNKSADRERVRPIHDALVAAGFDVFWDQKVPAGQDWDKFIRGHLTGSKCAIVFWSRESIGSDNVRHEATVAKDQGKLITVLLEPLTAQHFPMGLYTLQAVTLPNWKGDFEDTEWKKLCREVEDRLTPLWVRQRTAEFEAELEAQRGRLAAVVSRDKVLRAQIAREARVQEELKHQHDKAMEEVGALKTAVEDLTQQRDKAMKEVGALKTAGKDLTQRRDKAMKEVAALKTAADDLTRQHDKAMKEVGALKTAGEDLTYQRDKAMEEVGALKTSVEELRRKCSEIESQAVELSQRLTESEAQRLLAQQSATRTWTGGSWDKRAPQSPLQSLKLSSTEAEPKGETEQVVGRRYKIILCCFGLLCILLSLTSSFGYFFFGVPALLAAGVLHYRRAAGALLDVRAPRWGVRYEDHRRDDRVR
jgi:hypothetical protein